MSIQKTTYTDEFKTQIVSLYNNGKPEIEILNEYKISSSTLYTWVNNFNKTQSFKASKNNYGTRKLKIELVKSKDKIIVSRRKIGKIMAKYGLISNYTIKQFKVHKSTFNHDKTSNLVKREFNGKDELEVVVSDLTYVNVKGKWNYICILLDIYNREIIGFSAGKNKTAALVQKAFRTVKTNLSNISIFHTDRGNEFKNKLIDETLITFGIKRSLSKKGCAYESMPHRV